MRIASQPESGQNLARQSGRSIGLRPFDGSNGWNFQLETSKLEKFEGLEAELFEIPFESTAREHRSNGIAIDETARTFGAVSDH